LLQPFYRAENQMHTSGFGLGLSIALKAINKHHGE
jgi:two-component system OmpR family sensor kinase